MVKAKPTRISIQAGAFAIVGVIGFAVDAGLFILLTSGLGVATLPARILAFAPATLVTWAINHLAVFRTPGRRYRAKTIEYANYLLVQGIGMGINFGVFYLTLKIFPAALPLVALAMGSIVAMVFNFTGSKLLVFRD